MLPYNPDHIWWRWIANPRRIFNSLIESISDQNTIIFANNNVPWIDYVRNRIAGKVQDDFHIIRYDIDASLINSQDVGEYLLHKFSSLETASNYRLGFSNPIEIYLHDNNVLQDKLIWIHNARDDQVIQWIEFLKKYRQKNLSDGLFFIECNNIKPDIENNRIKFINYSNEIDFYDVLSFSMMIISNKDLDKTMKQYLAWSAALIFQQNIESLADFINFAKDWKNLKKNLIQFLSENGHNLGTSQLENFIWQSQMQIFFPIIEKHRTELIKRYYDKINKVLQAENILWFDEKIENPYDVEFGLLVNLTTKTMGVHKNPLYINDTDYKLLHLLRDCRNTIAHLGIIDDQAIEKLLK